MPDLPLVLWFGFGQCLSATRDFAGSAMRDFLIGAVNMAGTLRVAGVRGWLEAVRVPPALMLLDEVGMGALRRVGRIAELDDLASGDSARVRRVLSRRLLHPPLTTLVPTLTRVLLGTSTALEGISRADELLRVSSGSATAQVDGLAALNQLEAALFIARGCLDDPQLQGVGGTAAARTTVMLKALQIDRRGSLCALLISSVG